MVVWWHIVGLSINKLSTVLVVVVGYFLEHHRSPWWVVGGVGGLLFVNYIVDASIFERRAFDDRVLVTASSGVVAGVWWWVCGVYF